MSPARPRSSSSARCTASSIASGDRKASGCNSEAGCHDGVPHLRRSSAARFAPASRSPSVSATSRAAASVVMVRWASAGFSRRIIDAVMRAAAFAPRPGGCRDQQRRGCHVAQRDVAGIALERSERPHGFREAVAVPDDADMRGHHRAQILLRRRWHGAVARRRRIGRQAGRRGRRGALRYPPRCARHRPRLPAASSTPAGWRRARRSTTLRRRPKVPCSEVRPCASTAMPPM